MRFDGMEEVLAAKETIYKARQIFSVLRQISDDDMPSVRRGKGKIKALKDLFINRKLLTKISGVQSCLEIAC
jgi:hypothetical protein